MDTNLMIVPAIEKIHEKNKTLKRKRVAAYCRVSLDKDEQLTSYHNQISYYIGLISQEIEWEFVDIYADEGISGTQTKSRNDFNRMIEDCRKGLIDIILVKSISRFARNTVDCLKYIRELRTLNIDVYFENEKIHSINDSSEFLITIHAMHAQEQSISISNNSKWAIRKSMENGTWIPTKTSYGYKIVDDEIIKDAKVEKIVDTIKNLYLDGYSFKKITEYLDSNGVETPRGNKKWDETAIKTILKDPLYRGHLVAQKTFMTDTFPFEQRTNHGELPKYQYIDDHEPYINEEEAKMIDNIMMIRNTLNGRGEESRELPKRNYLSGKVICYECKSKMSRVKANSLKNIGYMCRNHMKDSTICSNQKVLINTIQSAFIKLCNKLKAYENLLDDYLKDLEVVDKHSKNHVIIEKFSSQYQDINKQIQKIVVSYNSGSCESAFYVQKIYELREEKNKVMKLQKMLRLEDGYYQEIESTKIIKRMLNFYQCGESFDEELFKSIVDHIEALNKKIIIFHLVNGMEIIEKVEE